jgi:hypothetical protein
MNCPALSHALAGPALAACVLAACASGSPAATGDPFSYCAAVGTIDAPDARYRGPAVPESIARGLQRAFGAPAETPLEPFVRGTSWRCMDGAVYACTVGANLPCGERADTDRAPRPAVIDFCRREPDAAMVPMYVTGRSTVYEWRCAGGTPEIARQVTAADARGFLSSVWHRIPSDP